MEMRLSTGRRHRHPRYERGFYPGYSIWEGAAAGGGSGGGHGGPLLEGDEDAEEEWFGEYDAAAVGGDGSSTCGGMLRYLHPPSASLGFCLPEGLPQDALVVLSALLTPAELMRLALASKALAARVGRGPGGAYPWLQKCLQAWDLPEGTALAQLSPDSRALDFAALYPDIVAWPSDIETDARRPLRRSPSTLALIQGRGHSGAFKVVDFHTVQFAGEGLGQGNRAVRATVPFPSLEDPTNRQQGKAAADGGDADDNSMWHRLQRFTRGLHLHLPPPTPSTVVPLSLAASAAAAAAAGSLSATATAAALMSSGYYYSSATAAAAAAAAAARGPNGGNGNSNGNNSHRVFPASFFPSYLSASLVASGGMAGSASALFSASAPASLTAFMAQHMPRVPTTTASASASPSRPLSPLQQLEQAATAVAAAEAEEDAKAKAPPTPQGPPTTPQGPRAFSAPWTRPDGALEVRPRLVAYYEVAIRPREGSPVPAPAPVVPAAMAAPVLAPPPAVVVEEEEDEPIFMVDEEENELAVLLNQQQQPPQPQQPQAPAQQQQQPGAAVGEGEGGNNCVAVGLAAEGFHLEGYMPGWDPKSYGFHSDDGGIFHGTGIKVRYYGPRFGAGDTVGCGLDYARKEIFFTLNGQYLGVAFDSVIPDTPLYPTVGIDSRHPVSLNFGEAPFAFDLDAYQGLRAAAEADKEEDGDAGPAGMAAAGMTHVAPPNAVPVLAPVQLP